ncbi:MAG: SAM hydroxide adenosyltransferase, partial [Longimicrobiales bacterium]
GPVRDTYGSVAPGEVVALVGSAGLIEVSIRNGDAASVLSAARGARVRARTR